MSINKLSTGATVKTRCPFCEEVKDHAVIAMIDEETVRIQCTSCDSAQDHEPVAGKRPVAKPAPKKATPLRGKTDPSVAEKKEWLLLRPNMNVEQAVDYQMNGRYPAKSLLVHAAFGLGLVTRIAGPHKVEVLFESGKKLLRCN